MRKCGLSIDVGTTNLVMRLVDMETGEALAEARTANPQAAYGADVTSRIAAADAQGLAQMQASLGDALAGLAGELIESQGPGGCEIASCALCGNTAMECIAFGVDPTPLGLAPYTVPEYFGSGWRYEPFARAGIFSDEVYVAPCVGPYVGGDITAGLLACGLAGRMESGPYEKVHVGGERVLFVDLGTNGEMALSVDGSITCCSVAAGPVFETVEGMHGTELIDAVADALEKGIIDETGRIVSDVRFCPGELHVRKLQLAKAAVCAGIRTLLFEYRLKPADVDIMYIAGLMGEHLNVGNAAAIGLFPRELASCARAVGNAALEGTSLLLCDEERAKMDRVVSACTYLELSGNPGFNARFINELEF